MQVDYSPWLNTSADLSATIGFQGDFSELTVNATSPRNADQVLAGASNLQDGINLAVPDATILIQAGTYVGDVNVNQAVRLIGEATIDGDLTASVAGATVDPGVGLDAGVFTVTGDLTMQAGSRLTTQINGTTVGTDLDQIVVTGSVNVNGAILDASLNLTAAVGTEIVLLSNLGADAVIPGGFFAGLAEGALVPLNGQLFQLSYAGGDGNDISLTLVTTPPVLLNINVTAAIREGETAVLTGTINDPDPTDAFTLRVFWGDGQSDLVTLAAGTTTFTLSHQYTRDGVFPVFVALTDTGGGTTTATTQVTVADTGIRTVVRFQNGRPLIDVRSVATGALLRTIRPFGVNFRGRVRVAVGDVTGDFVPDVVVIKERGFGAVVRVFDGATGVLRAAFRPFPSGVNAQFFLRVGAFNSDARLDIFVTAVAGGVVRTRVFSGVDFRLLAAFPGLAP